MKIINSILLFQSFSTSLINAAATTNSTKYFSSFSAIKPQSKRFMMINEASAFDQCIMETSTVLNNIPDTNHLMFGDWKAYCPGFPQEKELNCDFSALEKRKAEKEECIAAGGQILPITVAACSISIYVDRKFLPGYRLRFNKLRIENFPQCSGMSCSTEGITRLIEGDNRLYGAACTKEEESDRFALRVIDGQLKLKSCKWLRKLSEVKKSRICQNKKFQVYTDGYLPASRTCPVTCANYTCVEQSPKSKFISDARLNETSGMMEPVLRYCSFLFDMDEDQRSRICSPTDKRLTYIDSKFGYGWEVCPDFCSSTCQRQTKKIK